MVHHHFFTTISENPKFGLERNGRFEGTDHSVVIHLGLPRKLGMNMPTCLASMEWWWYYQHWCLCSSVFCVMFFLSTDYHVQIYILSCIHSFSLFHIIRISLICSIVLSFAWCLRFSLVLNPKNQRTKSRCGVIPPPASSIEFMGRQQIANEHFLSLGPQQMMEKPVLLQDSHFGKSYCESFQPRQRTLGCKICKARFTTFVIRCLISMITIFQILV